MIYSAPSFLFSPFYNGFNDNSYDFYNQPYEPNQNKDINDLMKEGYFPNIFTPEHNEEEDEDNETNRNNTTKSNKNQDEQLNENNFKTIELKEQNLSKQNENILNGSGNIITKATSKTLGLKTKRSDWIIQNNENENKKKGGRKKKTEIEKGDHTKFSPDNLMRKIKSHLLDYIHLRLNKSLKNQNLQFLKLFSDINENLKKDYNMELMEKTIRELYENSPISNKYRKKKSNNSDNNKNIIQQIYEETNADNLEIEAMNILDSTYQDLLIEFRNKNFNEFLEDIEKEEKSKGETKENIDSYKEKIGDLCMNYENWFKIKKGRIRNKSNKNNYNQL